MLIATGQKNSFYELDVGCWFGKREDSGHPKWRLYGSRKEKYANPALGWKPIGRKW
jgi:hypothetical protein